jgi:septal ring-binding cell division protein DamX
MGGVEQQTTGKKLSMAPKNLSIFLLIYLLISGCAVNYANKSPQEVASAVVASKSEQSQRISFSGPQILKEDSLGRRITDHLRYQLMGWFDQEYDTLSNQLQVNIWYEANSWRDYQAAHFGNGSPLPVKKIRTKLNCMGNGSQTPCAREETIGIELEAPFLNRHVDKGFTLHISAKEGHEHIVHVPASYIQGYLMAMEKHDIREEQAPPPAPPMAQVKRPAEASVAVAPKPPSTRTPQPQPASPSAANSPIGTFEEGLAAMQQQDYSKAYGIWLVLAQDQHAEAQAHLSELYARGLGVDKNSHKAQHWLASAAFGGYAPAQFNLGSAYQSGQFGEKDMGQAAYWWRQAAQQGFVPAQYNLGRLYLMGEGMPKDVEAAKLWFRKAAAAGSEEALAELQKIEPPRAAMAPIDETPEYSWIASQPKQFYTVQLFVSGNQRTADDFITNANDLGRLGIFSFERDGKTLYAVIFGSFESPGGAKRAVDKLPPNYQKSGVWIRSFNSIHQIMSTSR